ncbi:MAG: hypothetical protein HYZ83_00585 [Candidatus Omnitrophica bacterium]|nr:hypothetical protein [Candidatus Omnitrophota bacterium]
MDYREGKKAEKFIPALIALAGQKNTDFSDLDQIQIFKKAFEIERKIQKDKLESEAKRLEEAYKRKGLHFEELLRANMIPKDKLEFYPETQKYLELIKVQDGLRYRIFFSQAEEAIRRLKEKLFIADEEKALDAKSERFLIAKKIALFQATPEDLKNYENQTETFRADLEEAGLAGAFDLALDFYQIAKRRDEIFFEKIMKDNRLRGNIAVVTGGFHTEGLSEKLAAQGISYIVVTPDLGKEPADEKLYFERLTKNPVSRQTLQENNNLQLDPQFDKDVAAVAKSEIRDTRDGVLSVLRNYQNATAPANDGAKDFMALSPFQQEEFIAKIAAQPGKSRFIMVAKRSELRKVLSNPSTLNLWQSQLQRGDILALIGDGQITDWEIGSPAEIRRLPGDIDFAQAVELQSIREKGKETPMVVFAGDFKTDKRNVIVANPNDEYFPALLRFLDAIMDAIAKGLIPYNAETFSVIQNILLKLHHAEASRISA